jgi:hypothetical protein
MLMSDVWESTMTLCAGFGPELDGRTQAGGNGSVAAGGSEAPGEMYQYPAVQDVEQSVTQVLARVSAGPETLHQQWSLESSHGDEGLLGLQLSAVVQNWSSGGRIGYCVDAAKGSLPYAK